jgi:saccharopine dehydrogenase-like NADP-dependent oxidoreductase
MATVLVLGGAGAMGSVAARDLIERTSHRVVIGDRREEASRALADRLGERAASLAVDVEDPSSLRAALGQADVVLNATFMRHNVALTRAAIDAGVNATDLGAYVDDTRDQLELDPDARVAGVRVVAGCGVAPGLTNLLAAEAAARLGALREVRIASFITHPMSTSPGIVYTRFDASVGTSLVLVDDAAVERPSFGDEEEVAFPEPYGTQEVHLVPHPEALTLPRSINVANVSFKVGYPPDETARIRALLELGFDADEPFAYGGTTIVPRDLAAAFIGRGGLPPDLPTANLKRVEAVGTDGRRFVADVVVERVGEPSASAAITGTVAAIATDLVAGGAGEPGVRAAEGALDPGAVLAALAVRGFEVAIREEPA